MTTPTSENQWLSNIINSNQFAALQAGTSNISYDDNGLIDSTTFELNWLRADDYGLTFLAAGSAYNSFSDASDGFEGAMTIYLETPLNEDGDDYYYLYEPLNTTGVGDPNYTIEDTDTYKVSYYNTEKTALQDRYVGEYDSFSDQLTAVFEAAVSTAVASSSRSTNRYVFRKVKEPILGTKNVSALTPVTETETTTTATTTATTTGTTTSY